VEPVGKSGGSQGRPEHSPEYGRRDNVEDECVEYRASRLNFLGRGGSQRRGRAPGGVCLMRGDVGHGDVGLGCCFLARELTEKKEGTRRIVAAAPWGKGKELGFAGCLGWRS
jgi:hypothetical protein